MRYVLPALLLATPAFADALDERATAVFASAYDEACNGAFLEDGGLIEQPQRFSMLSPVSWDDEPVPVELWMFRCNLGAYNVQSVLVARTEADGLHPIALARPDIDIVLEDPADHDSAVKELRVVGWSASPFVFNAEVDVARGELRETVWWRGLGDASSSAVWRLVDESFRLVRQEVDPTYDGEINPSTVVQFD